MSNTKYFVICGNHQEFIHYTVRKLPEERADFTYVNGPDALRGSTNPKGFFYGSWRERSDILEIVEMLVTRYTMGVIPVKVFDILKELRAEKKEKEAIEALKKNLESQDLVKFVMDNLVDKVQQDYLAEWLGEKISGKENF